MKQKGSKTNGQIFVFWRLSSKLRLSFDSEKQQKRRGRTKENTTLLLLYLFIVLQTLFILQWPVFLDWVELMLY